MSETAQQNAAILADFQMHKLDRHLAEIARIRLEVGVRPTPDRAGADLLYQLQLEVQRAAVVIEDISWNAARAVRMAKAAAPKQKAERASQAWPAEAIVAAMQAWKKRFGRAPTMREWLHVDPRGERPSVDQVLAIFPTWNDARIAAGFLPRTGGRSNFEEQAA